VSRILVIGGYGGFGARLCRRLAEAGHTLLVAGRSRDKAGRFAAGLEGARPLVLDRNDDIGPVLAQERPKLVIDAAGPFQETGYDVPEACIGAGIPYLDLADARAFVCGIGVLDEAARAAGVAVVSGASTAPALTSAILARLAEGLDRVDSVDIALSAANRAAGARSLFAGILSYAGRPVRLWRGGRWTDAAGWQELRREDFLFADGSGLRRRLVAVADLPDCEILPGLLPGRPAVTFRAGTELGFQMRSAMSVTLAGSRGGDAVERRWTIVAEDGEGLEIPTLVAELLAADVLTGRLPPGAYTAAGRLPLPRFEPLLAKLPVRVEISERRLPPPLYERAMGAAFHRLPPAIRRMHEINRNAGAAGEAVVTRGRGFVSRLLARPMGFPPEGTWPLHVAFAERNGIERWTRDYGGHLMRSELSEAAGGGVIERFGPIRFAFDLVPRPGGLDMRLRGWSFFHLPLPRALAPHIEAGEREEDGRFRFDVRARLPLVGEVVRYAGWLEPVA
jgi:NAD(P)-dependent dehydrogenase (short-subunit alcohol dehydrogenase family)